MVGSAARLSSLHLLVALAALAAGAASAGCSGCEGSFDKQARADLRNAAVAEELAFALRSPPVYVTCEDEECEKQLPGFKRSSPYVHIAMRAEGRGFVGTAKHRNSWNTWTWDSRAPDQPQRK